MIKMTKTIIQFGGIFICMYPLVYSQKDYESITINLHENVEVQYAHDLVWPTLSIIDPRT